MKAKSASMSLYHILAGHHREATMWHDADHKAEVLGAMANVFISQRWVTPPDWLPLRAPSPLAESGGEYVNLYWSTGTPAELDQDFAALGDRLTRAGRMEPATKYMQMVWPQGSAGRMVPLLMQGRPGLEISGQAVTASTAMTGLLTRVERIQDEGKRDSFNRWHEAEYIPMVLETGLFAGIAKLGVLYPGGTGQFVTLYYLDTPNPVDEYKLFRQETSQWRSAQKLAPCDEASYGLVFESIAQPSIGQYDIYP
jgi:hypothetical protein